MELGCGPGFLLELARDSGFKIKGIEIADVAAQKARELLGEDIIIKADAAKVDFINQSYDCVVMDNFLEHTQDPLKLLIRARSALKDNGLIVICSPDIDGLYVKFIKGNSYILRPNEHIWQFSSIAIRNLLKKAGYRLIRIKPISPRMLLQFD